MSEVLDLSIIDWSTVDMSSTTESVESVPVAKPWLFKKGVDQRRGRGPAPGRQKGSKNLRPKVEARAAEMTIAALERMKADIEKMDERALAQWLAKPALQHLHDVVLDENAKPEHRLTAASTLLAQGWAKAPSAVINANINADSTNHTPNVDEIRQALANMVRARPDVLELVRLPIPGTNHTSEDSVFTEIPAEIPRADPSLP